MHLHALLPDEFNAAVQGLRGSYSDRQIAKVLNVQVPQFRLWYSNSRSAVDVRAGPESGALCTPDPGIDGLPMGVNAGISKV